MDKRHFKSLVFTSESLGKYDDAALGSAHS